MKSCVEPPEDKGATYDARSAHDVALVRGPSLHGAPLEGRRGLRFLSLLPGGHTTAACSAFARHGGKRGESPKRRRPDCPKNSSIPSEPFAKWTEIHEKSVKFVQMSTDSSTGMCRLARQALNQRLTKP